MITAESVEYFNNGALPINANPPPANRTFRLSYLTPFATRLYTEVIGCISASPAEMQTPYTLYTPTSNGYDPGNAPYKFIRQVWNNAIVSLPRPLICFKSSHAFSQVPLATIEGGACAGRSDGMCPLQSFLQSQADAEKKVYSCQRISSSLLKFNRSGTGELPVRLLRKHHSTACRLCLRRSSQCFRIRDVGPARRLLIHGRHI